MTRSDAKKDGDPRPCALAIVGGWIAASLAAAGPAPECSLEFRPLPPIGLSQTCFDIACADFDGDGRIDLAVTLSQWLFAGTQPGAVLLFWNRGDLSFAGPTSIPLGPNPAEIVAADLDDDGDRDLVVAESGAASAPNATISVLLNRGDGTFERQILSAGPLAYGVAVADFAGDGDGFPDIAVMNATGAHVPGTVTLQRNLGDARDWERSDYDGANSPFRGVPCDLGPDGFQDLAVANWTGDSVSVFWNDRKGGLGFRSDIPLDHEITDVASADFDGDGIADLVAANLARDKVWVLRNAGQAGFVNSSTPTPHWPFSVVPAELDGDGALEVLVGYRAGSAISILDAWNGEVFEDRLDLQAGLSPSSVAAADLDGDGDLDLVAVNYGGMSVSIFENVSHCEVPAGTPFIRADANQSGGIDIADAVCVLDALFGPPAAPCRTVACRDALDTNDSGALDIGDAIFLLNWLFAGGPGPPPPGGDACGLDATPDAGGDLGCTHFAACP